MIFLRNAIAHAAVVLRHPLFWTLVCVFLVAALYGKLFFPPLSVGDADPDRYFHLWIAQKTALQGMVHAIPQVDNLSWAKRFPDKEFLFHQIAALGYRLHGDWGALSVVPLSALAILLALFFSCCSKRLFKLPAWIAFLSASLPLFACGPFTFRLFLMRPHLFGIFFWLICLIGMLASRPWMAFLGAVFFALSYHAFYVPLVLTAVFLVSVLILRVQPQWKLFFTIPLGLCIGILINPYFPGNVIMSWLHLKIALDVSLPFLKRGDELNALPVFMALSAAKFQLAGLLGAALYAGYLVYKKEILPFRLFFLLFLSVVLGAMYLQIPRANEYWLPASALLLAEVVSRLGRRFGYGKAGLGLLLFCGISLGSSARDFYRSFLTVPYVGHKQITFDALERIPASASGQKVFNCNWSIGAWILYRRPDLSFVDLLDPTFLYEYDPQAHQLRNDLNEGRIVNPSEVIRQSFHARYVICDKRMLNFMLSNDPGARALDSITAPGLDRTFELIGEIQVPGLRRF